MQYTCQSEYKILERVFIKTAEQAFISEEKLKKEAAEIPNNNNIAIVLLKFPSNQG